MKIFLIQEGDALYRYAAFSHVGTWTDEPLCNACECSRARLVEPLLVHWEAGSDVIAHFSWCGYTTIVVPQVREFLEREHFRLQFGDTVMMPPCEPFKGRKIVPFPYTGPPLSWLICNQLIDLDERASGVQLEIDCDVCGTKRYSFKMDGIVIPRSNWSGQRVFRIRQFGPSAATYVTEDALHQIRAQEFTNLGYIEVGRID